MFVVIDSDSWIIHGFPGWPLFSCEADSQPAPATAICCRAPLEKNSGWHVSFQETIKTSVDVCWIGPCSMILSTVVFQCYDMLCNTVFICHVEGTPTTLPVVFTLEVMIVEVMVPKSRSCHLLRMKNQQRWAISIQPGCKFDHLASSSSRPPIVMFLPRPKSDDAKIIDHQELFQQATWTTELRPWRQSCF